MTLANFELTTPAGDAVRKKYRREGADIERERIIKLLEDRKSVYKELMDSAESRGALPTADHWEEMIVTLNSHIALIKGENK